MSVFALFPDDHVLLACVPERDRRQRPDRRETWRGGRRVTDFSGRGQSLAAPESGEDVLNAQPGVSGRI